MANASSALLGSKLSKKNIKWTIAAEIAIGIGKTVSPSHSQLPTYETKNCYQGNERAEEYCGGNAVKYGQ